MKNVLFSSCVIGILSLFAVSFFSCEIGLGETVDTKPPLVSIENPVANSILGGTISLLGTCSDEQEIARVEVVLSNTDYGFTTSTYLADIKSNNTWSLEINPREEDPIIPDGKYEVIATAFDKAGRHSPATTAFSIDNTPPFVILERPSSSESSENPDAFGLEFRIQGRVLDSSEIKGGYVKIFDSAVASEALRVIELPSLSSSIDLPVLKRDADAPDSEESADYNAVYGNSSGTKNFYFTIELEDVAGNKSEEYFLNNDIYTEIIKKYTSLIDVYNITSGSYALEKKSSGRVLSASDWNQAKVEESLAVIEFLESKEISKGSFSLNPANNPTYQLVGLNALPGTANEINEKFEVLTSSETSAKYGVYSGSQIQVKLSSGLDKSPIEKDSIGIYLLPFDMDQGQIVENIEENRINIVKNGVFCPAFNSDSAAITAIGSYDFMVNAYMEIGLDGENGALKSGRPFILFVEGHDKDGIAFVNSCKYGFILLSTGFAPKLTVTEPGGNDKYIKKGEGFTVKGLLSSESASLVQLYVNGLDDEGKETYFPVAAHQAKTAFANGVSNASWELTMPASCFNQDVSKDYSIKIRAEDKSNSSSGTDRFITVHYDADPPVVNVNGINPKIPVENEVYRVNGKITVNITVTDNYFALGEQTSITFVDVDTETSLSTFSTSDSFITHDFNTNSFNVENGKLVKMLVIASDLAGNVTKNEETLFVVDQETDRPVITLQNAYTIYENSEGVIFDFTKDSVEDYPENTSVNTFTKGYAISASVSDDDGIKSIEVRIHNTDGHTIGRSVNGEYSNPHPFTFNLPDEFGMYYCTITVKDTETEMQNNPFKFWFTIDQGEPVISVTKPSLGIYYGKTGGQILVKGRVSGSGGLQLYKGNNSSGSDKVAASYSINQNISEAEWQDLFEVPAGNSNPGSEYSAYYFVEDAKNRSGSASFSYKVDDGKPLVEIEASTKTLFNTEIVRFSGTASDSLSGITSVWYKLNAGELDSEIIANAPSSEIEAEGNSGWKKFDGTEQWSVQRIFKSNNPDLSLNELVQGKYTLYVRSFDAAQNASDIDTHTFTVDLDIPEIIFKVVKNPSEEETSSVVVSDNGKINLKKADKDFILKAEITDTLGLSESQAYTFSIVNNSESKTLVKDTDYEIQESDISGGKKLFISFKEGKKLDGSYSVNIKAKDSSLAEAFHSSTFIFDTTAPEIIITNPVIDENTWLSSSNLKIQGYAQDSVSGIKAIYYKASKVESISALSDLSGNDWQLFDGKFTFALELSDLDEGEKTYSFAAVDEFDNFMSEPELCSLKIDLENPEIFDVNIDNDYITASDFKISGKIKDSYKLQGFLLTARKGDGDPVELLSFDNISENSIVTEKAWESSLITTGTNGAFEDGSWIFTAEVWDEANANHHIKENFRVVIDTQKPVVSSFAFIWPQSDLSAEDSEGLVWHSSLNPGIKILASDSGSGIESLEYIKAGLAYTEDEIKNVEPIGNIQADKNEAGSYKKETVLLDSGLNYLYAKVTDKAGNITYYGANGSVSAAVDKESPVIVFEQPGTQNNLSINIPLTYKIRVYDDLSGIPDGTSVSLSVGSINLNPVVSAGYLHGTIPVDVLEVLRDSDSARIQLTVLDAVGNSKTDSIMLSFDNVNPEVSILKPSDNGVNGNLIIEGKASDDNFYLTSVVLYWKIKNSASDWQELKTFTGESVYNWYYGKEASEVFDTSSLDKKIICLKAVATDLAQNTAVVEKEVTVDLDFDRPTINVKNPKSLNGMTSSNFVLNKEEKIRGTIEDDDGEIKEFWIKVGTGDWIKEGIYSAGEWEYNFNAKLLSAGGEDLYNGVGDGNAVIAFHIKDAGDTVFESVYGAEQINAPKIVDYSNNKFALQNSSASYDEDASSFVYLKTDTQSPIVKTEEFSIDGENWKSIDDIERNIFGGEGSLLYIRLKAEDINGISTFNVKLNGESGSEVLKTSDATTSTAVYSFSTEKAAFASSFESGTVNLVYYAIDNANRSSIEYRRKVQIDNKNPVITVRSPKSGTEVYSSSSVNVRGHIEDDSDFAVYMKISSSDVMPEASGLETATSDLVHWKNNLLDWHKFAWSNKDDPSDSGYTSASEFSISFSGEVDKSNTIDGTDCYAGTFTNYYEALFGTVSEASLIENVYIWFAAIDKFNNVKVSEIPLVLKVNPHGDKPIVEITYPLIDAKLGGTIRITGTASVNSGVDASVEAVYLQIQPDGAFSNEWRDAFMNKVGEANIYSDLNSGGRYHLEVVPEIESGYGIKVNGTTSWNLPINASGELIYTENGEKKSSVMTIRAFALSTSHKVSELQTVTVTLDPNSPVIGEYKLVSDSDSGNIISYSDGMWLKGLWHLETNVYDDNGINSVSWKDDSGITTYLVQNGEKLSNLPQGYLVEDYEDDDAGVSGFKISCPVGNGSADSVGSLQYSLEIEEDKENAQPVQGNIRLYYDNKAPEFEATDASYKNELASSGIKVQQTNGAYTLFGTFRENSVLQTNQSGFKRILLSFTRMLSGQTYVLDPMLLPGDSGEDNMFPASEFESPAADGIYWRKVRVSKAQNASLTLSQAVHDNIRIGGICKFNESIFRIEDIDYDNKIIYLDSALVNEDSSGDHYAYFALAQVIDNLTNENFVTSDYKKSGYDAGLSNDDLDQMVEGVSARGSTWNWNASINSSNMLDGPVSINFTAFDDAGNFAVKTYSGTISNNRPRIAGVLFGTDDNGNGSVEEAEIQISAMYSHLYISEDEDGEDGMSNVRNRVENLNIGTSLENRNKPLSEVGFASETWNSVMNVKGAVSVRPEIVGGNKGIDWGYKLYNSSGSLLCSEDNCGNLYNKHSSSIKVREAAEEDITFTTKYMLEKTGFADGKKLVLSVVFSDKTPVQVQSAVINICTNISLRDDEAAKTSITPFFWKSKTENSIFESSFKNGHIELSSDWINASGYDANAVSGQYDKDPKVSGIVSFRGKARDNVLLESLKASVSGFNEGNAFEIASYDSENSEWDLKSVLSDGKLPATGWAVEILNEDISNENGHSVDWVLHFDTSKIAGGADDDVELEVTAYDRGKASVSSGSIVHVPNTPDAEDISTYQFDVVPYITRVKTSLDKLKVNNPSVYSRTALGHYAVRSDETVTLEGFNLGDSTSLDISSLSASGAFELTVNGIKSLNNKNYDDSKGDYAGTVDLTTSPTGDKDTYSNYYNRQPNGDNNNLLTDDVIFDVWEINPQSGKPTSGPLSQPVMAINPKNKQVGFAFASGPLYFGMGDLNNSYQTWEGGLDFWTSIGFAYDSNGNSFGTAAGGDINGTPDADQFGIFTSRWGVGETSTIGHNCGQGWLRLEVVGQSESTDGTNFNGNNVNKQRIKSPSFATTVENETATSTNVYLAYYDEINDEVRFRWGIFTDSGNRVRTTAANDLFEDYYGNPGSQGSTDNSKSPKIASKTKSKTVVNLPYTLEYVSLIAGQTKDKWTFVPGSPGTKYQANTAVMTDEEIPQPVCAGQYVSIAAKYHGGDTYNIGTEEEPVNFTDDLVVAVWYDATNNQMLYSYNKTPQKIKAPTYGGNNYNTIDSYSQSATGWSTPVAIFGEGNGIGEYCKVVMDNAGQVHIACYDNSNADVWYAFIGNPLDPENTTRTCIVDSYGIVGSELSIDVAVKNSIPVPYISYYGSSCARPKVAYWNVLASIASAASIDGAVEDASTKNWEISVIPSSSKISLDHINVGVWKDSEGNLTYSTTDGNVPNGKTPGTTGANVGKSNAGTSNGMIYGNGSKNPILGYAITKGAGGFIETAQMK